MATEKFVTGEPFVHVEDLVVEYSTGGYSVRPIDELSLTVPRGSLTLLLGPSGCGKTTLLSCLAGILTPTAGKLMVGDTDVPTLRGAALTEYRRHEVGIVFQAFNLIDSLSASENVMVPMVADPKARSGARERANELLDAVGLAERRDHKPGQMSGGQQQRVAIARAIALDPPLVLADEPTAHLDYIQVEGVLRLLRGLTEDGRAIVVSTHDERMLPLADQVVEMQPSFHTGRVPEVHDQRLSAGDILFEQGDVPDFIYVIEEGAIEILRESSDGQSEVVAQLSAGDHFGEMGPLFGLRRSATARAASDTVLRVMTAPTFREWLGDDAHLSAVIAGRA